MSSLIKRGGDNTSREVLKSESEIMEDVRKKNREYQKEQRGKHLDNWKSEKAVVDSLRGDELLNYIENNDGSSPRIGLHGMKINSQEHAIIKRAMEITNARSSREIFVNFCKEIIKIDGETKGESK